MNQAVDVQGSELLVLVQVCIGQGKAAWCFQNPDLQADSVHQRVQFVKPKAQHLPLHLDIQGQDVLVAQLFQAGQGQGDDQLVIFNQAW